MIAQCRALAASEKDKRVAAAADKLIESYEVQKRELHPERLN
jgi:hypothetical protein